MGLRHAVAHLARARRVAAQTRAARGLQRRALSGAYGRTLALLPTNFPPWAAVYQQARRWLEAGCFEALVHDLRMLLRALHGPRAAADGSDPGRPRAAIEPREWRAGRLQWAQAAQRLEGPCGGGYPGPAAGAPRHASDADERTQVAALAEQVQAVTGQRGGGGLRRSGSTGEEAAATAAAHGLELPGGRPARGQARFRPAAPPVGGGENPVILPIIRS